MRLDSLSAALILDKGRFVFPKVLAHLGSAVCVPHGCCVRPPNWGLRNSKIKFYTVNSFVKINIYISEWLLHKRVQ